MFSEKNESNCHPRSDRKAKLALFSVLPICGCVCVFVYECDNY